MEKTSVYLTDQESERLEWLAKQEGRSQADILRSAIMAYEPACYDRNFELFGAFSVPGLSIADIPDDELMKGFGE